MIEINFDDDIVEVKPRVIKMDDDLLVKCSGREVSLDRPLAPTRLYLLGSTKLEYLSSSYYTETYSPYAFTFTFPVDLVPVIKKIITNAKGQIIEKYIKNTIGELPFSEQWVYFLKLFNVWLSRCEKAFPKGIGIGKFDIYPELTKQNVIHVHGLFYINSLYFSGISDVCAMTWCKVSKASYKATIKHNAKGGIDKAFDKCTNVECWTQYILKGYGKIQGNEKLEYTS